MKSKLFWMSIMAASLTAADPLQPATEEQNPFNVENPAGETQTNSTRPRFSPLRVQEPPLPNAPASTSTTPTTNTATDTTGTGTVTPPATPSQVTVSTVTSSDDNGEPKTVLSNFNNVNVSEYIRYISRVSNKNFVFDENELQFNVTIVSEEPTSIKNSMAALLQVLRIHGLYVLEEGNNIIISSNPKISSISHVVAEGLPFDPTLAKAELVTRVFKLNTLDAEKAAIIVQPLVSQGAIVELIKETSHLIVTDITTNVEKINLLLKALDSPMSGLSIGQYAIENGLIDSLIDLAERIMIPIAEGKTLVFVPHKASNSVFIVSTPYIVERTLAVLQTLDANVGLTRIFSPDDLRYNPNRTGGLGTDNAANAASAAARNAAAGAAGAAGAGGGFGTGTGFGSGRQGLSTGGVSNASPWANDLPLGNIERTQFYIHKLRYRKGDQIVTALGNIGASLTTSSSNLDLITTINSVQWLESSNSLIITGTSNAIAKVNELIDEIDVPLRQVYIEMLILQTTIDDSLEYGVNWGARFGGGNSSGAEAFLTGASRLPGALNTTAIGLTPDASTVAVDPGYTLGIIGRTLTHAGTEFHSIGALVKAKHEKNKTSVLMNPKLLMEDNTTAEIFVGINTPFQSQSIANNNGNIITTNVEFRDVGTRMKITPLISNTDIITLTIEEEVSSIGQSPTTSGNTLTNQNPGPTTNISRTNTRVHIPNEYFLIISGMIQDSQDRTRKQVPCLGGVPLLGGLFSELDLDYQKRNLMIFLRPLIIDSQEQIDELSRRQQHAFSTQNKTKKMWKWEVEEALNLLNVQRVDDFRCDPEQYNP